MKLYGLDRSPYPLCAGYFKPNLDPNDLSGWLFPEPIEVPTSDHDTVVVFPPTMSVVLSSPLWSQYDAREPIPPLETREVLNELSLALVDLNDSTLLRITAGTDTLVSRSARAINWVKGEFKYFIRAWEVQKVLTKSQIPQGDNSLINLLAIHTLSQWETTELIRVVKGQRKDSWKDLRTATFNFLNALVLQGVDRSVLERMEAVWE